MLYISLTVFCDKLLIVYPVILLAGVILFLLFLLRFKRSKKDLEEKNHELVHLNAAKDKFISVMAHDLKTPAGNIKSLAEMLMENFDELSAEDRKNCIEMLVESARTHSTMLITLLDLSKSRLRSKPFVPEKLDVRKVVNIALEQTKLQAQRKHIKICAQVDDFCINGDKSMIVTVIRNIVVNSIKFSHLNGQIVVKATKDAKEVTISVSDNGVGIPEAKQARIFKIDPEKSTTGTANETGTGLGLLLCKEYVEQHGGHIWFTSKEGEGTTFYFSLPLL